ncbi:acyl-CoA reductase-like NAD-dependent aldehyde dehydrogenase [Rhodoligotrophos appendicifer]|uniref:aldehyde dehydrogenase family protein n=1 Tax=Rhodoligotrophos appendicifer TaxID=987056 RepID=UPI0011864BC9|nr:aldehyde dehydrogenase family protein [Rhodoligotrophos appendicifer]
MSETLKIISPVDGSLYAERPTVGDGAVEAAFKAARAAQQDWKRLSVEERGRYCSAMVDAMLAMSAEIVPELAWQMGRPVRYGAGELRGFEERARHMIGIAAEALAPLDPGPKEGFKRSIKRDPLGVVFTIAPWNYPYLTAVNSIIPALMAGNAVVLKHATQTLLVGERFASACTAAGLPEGLFSTLVMGHDVTAKAIAGGLPDMVCFTGSVAGGRTMERAAVGQFMGLGLELGGKDPAYVRRDADIAHAVENLVDGAFFNSGQSCCGIERIYVDAAVYDAFVEGAVALTRGYVLGNPLEEATTIGPMVKSSAADFVRGQIDAAVRSGATAHVDEAAFAASKAGTPYLAPQILTGVNHQMSVMREESFGPVVGIMKVSGDDEAVTLMNDSAFGLTAAIWTSDVAAAEALGDRLETGTVFMNRCDYLDPALAWTGVKDSGRGVTLSRLGYDALTRPKSFHLRMKTGSA